MLFAALTATLETAFNTWLKLDKQTHGTALERLQALQGKLICLHISNPDLKLYFLPTADTVRVTTTYEAEPDVTIHGSALALMRLSSAEDTGKAMLEQGIKIDGDMGLGNRFSQILREIDVDWEELLSRAVGDVIAHQMGQLARATKGWLEDSAHAMRLNTQEYLQEEARLVPADAELRQYLDAVDTLRMDTDRLEARLKRLESNH
ncbi:MAG TPA: SCP2 sterol-binding domain-containing protein [Candidatus Thiothrix moscowensis]|uniref:ubiquinone biosynthesis accessory factor UbiJ n=1 Tax=unclassified Thiothrix TaxID=2636184 RepID=UPI001A1A2B9F|nr:MULTISPECIES: SCP2 sterol-binding domain-containing protein [unclassified Thiothrix]MBJ6610268.1 SCP2 sterol-binding domain-containing protein [Candidatus Thiothrix moscowensis]HRJ51527.1 SCP2 sterol-binding domain-containing protein [Candidatus Thiothrix moscowensis]HRJ91842.1 SCP2 sterol-binding domain-containing protein [Candidatus Thiothrix moscowensis]